MKAFVFTRHHHIEPMKYDIPELPEGHALIKLSHCGISQMDIDTYTGREPKVVPPRVLGNEICGIVKQINSPDVPSELEGTRVAVDPVIGCGQCSACIAGNSNHCENLEVIGLTCNGGFAEYVIVPVKNLYPLPDTEDIECFTLASALASALHLGSIIRLQEGSHCVILGSRPFDVLCGLVLRRMNDIRVAIVDDNSFRLNIAQSLGLSCIDLHSANLNNIMGECFSENDRSADAVIIGSSQIQNALSLGIDLVRPKGQILFIRNLQNDEHVESEELIEKELIYAGINLYAKENFKRSINDIANHIDNYSALITHRLPYEGISNGLQILETVSECMQVILMDNINKF